MKPSSSLPLLSFVAQLALLAGCSGSDAPSAKLDPSPAPPSAIETDAGEAPPDAGASGPTCADGEHVPIHVQANEDLSWLYGEVTREDGRTAVLSVDTGSPLTFVFPDRPGATSPKTGELLTLGCTAKTIAPYPVPDNGFSIDGLRQIGILGADWMLERPTMLDPAAKRLTRFADGETIPDVGGFYVAKVEIVKKQMLATVTIDGTSVRLIVDTGSPDVLWLGQEGRPGDRVQRTADAKGNIIVSYIGPSRIAFAGEPEHAITVARTPSFPYLDDKIKYLGGNIQGLLGMSAFGSRRILIDGKRSELWLAKP